MPGGQAHASEPRVVSVQPAVRDGKLQIDADVEFELNQQLRDAAQRGVPLYFTADLTVTRDRWWWFNKSLVDTTRTWRVTYNALTRQWRAGVGELSFPVASLDDAMSVIRHIRNWQVADADDFDEDTRYDGQLRLRLDTSLLPRPFQVNALNSSSWIQATPGSISSSRSTAWRKTHHEVAAQAGPGGGRHQRPGAAGPVGLVHR